MIEPDRLELFAPPRYRFDVGRRDFFRIAGSGLVVACAITNIEAQESGRNRREDLPTDIVEAPGTGEIEKRIAKIREQVLSRGDLISLIEQIRDIVEPRSLRANPAGPS